MTVHWISVEQASRLEVALQTRHPDEPFPPCTVCGKEPTEIRSWRDPLTWPGERLAFADCGHIIAVDWRTCDDWCGAAESKRDTRVRAVLTALAAPYQEADRG